MSDLSLLSQEDFAPLINTVFRVEQAVDLTLFGIKEFPNSGVRDRVVNIDGTDLPPRKAFALTFIGPASPILAPQMYKITHPEFADLELFLSCFGQDGAETLYEAVFN